MSRSPRSARSRRLLAPLAGIALAATTATTATTATAVVGSAAVPAAGEQTRAADATMEESPVSLVRVLTPLRSDKERLQALGLDLTEHAGRDYVEVVLHTVADRLALEAAKFDYEVEIRDLVRRAVQVARMDKAYAAATRRSALPSGRTSYRTLADYNREMRQLAQKNPRLVSLIELPHESVEGRTVYGVEIARNVKRVDDGRPTFLLMGVHHAREWPSGELAMEFARDLVKNVGSNKRITRLASRARTVVVPVVNVDGFRLSRTDGEFVDLRDANDIDPLDGSTSVLATPGQAYKRKNCSVAGVTSLPAGSCRATVTSPGGFGVGTDLNRNYSGFWGGPGAAGDTPDTGDSLGGPLNPTYRGPAPFSEPETQNIRDLVASRQVTMLISNHTFSNLVLRPNGVAPTTIGPDGDPVGDAPDERALRQLGRRMTEANGYQNIHGWELYDTTGTTEDWSYNATGGFGYTFEIGEDEFHPPFAEVVTEYAGDGALEGNREAYLLALEHAGDTDASAVLRGTLPRKAVLRLRKTFNTPTWESSVKESISSTLRSRGGAFRWVVNPSTRPVVKGRTVERLARTPFKSVTDNGTVPAPSAHTDTALTVSRRTDLLRVGLSWPLPDDLDLEVYRRDGADLTLVGSSANAPGEKESAEVVDARAGEYVLRVVNYTAVPGQRYALTSDLFDARTRTTRDRRERYTLTCGVKGEVFTRTKVYVDRGDDKRLSLASCARQVRAGRG
ncbi:hypothetical protein KLP28_04285 [Nocardioidaceae bacterium]|nr:hypothetical protein KLP28_04285 [Nocardioidaceae bacterium]